MTVFADGEKSIWSKLYPNFFFLELAKHLTQNGWKIAVKQTHENKGKEIIFKIGAEIWELNEEKKIRKQIAIFIFEKLIKIDWLLKKTE